MGSAKPTKVSVVKAIYLCLLLMFDMDKFINEEKKDQEKRQKLPDGACQTHEAFIVRNAIIKSFFLVLSAGFVGFILGISFRYLDKQPAALAIKGLQIFGALLLLWGTLFVRGFEIQSYAGVNFTERVNQWIYRGLYFSGTAIVVLSLVWQ
jgi:predicted membrane protein